MHDGVAVGVRGRHVEGVDLLAVEVERCVVSEKVTTGSAAFGDAGTFMSKSSMNCSALIRLRTLSCATMSDAGLAEVLVAAGVVAVPVRVEHEADRLVA